MYARMDVMVSAFLICVLMCTTGCSTTPPKRLPAEPQATRRVEAPKSQLVTLHKKPQWLLIGGIDAMDSMGGDYIGVRGKTLVVPGLEFEFENDEPDENPIQFTPLSRNRVIYWKGKGAITNTITRERLLVPPTEDSRSEAERKAYLEQILDGHKPK